LNLISAPFVNGKDRKRAQSAHPIRQPKEAEMSILNAFDHYLVGFRARRELARTERMISNLPPDVQKDIGWPQAREDAHDRLIRERGRNGGM
jgi:hypothetical protein